MQFMLVIIGNIVWRRHVSQHYIAARTMNMKIMNIQITQGGLCAYQPLFGKHRPTDRRKT